MPGKCLRDVALGQLAGCEMGLTLESEEGALGQLAGCEYGFDLGKRRRRSSTPAVVPGAAPALAKAGVGG